MQSTWLGETQQGQVNILAVLFTRYDEMKNLEVLAVNDQRASWGGGWLFLHAAHQTVEKLESTHHKIITMSQPLINARYRYTDNLPMIHCAPRRRSPRRWCVWPSGTGCPPGSFWGTLCREASHSPPGRGTGSTSVKLRELPPPQLSSRCGGAPINEALISRRTLAAYVAVTAHALSIWSTYSIFYARLTLWTINSTSRVQTGRPVIEVPVRYAAKIVANHCKKTDYGYLW